MRRFTLAHALIQSAYEVKSRVLQRSVRRTDSMLLRNESMAPQALAAQRRSDAMGLTLHAFDRTNFYRDSFKNAGFNRSDLMREENFQFLPILTKKDLRAASADFVASGTDPVHLLPSSTGGSTGEPLRLFHDRRAPIASMWRRAYRWWGISPADHQATVYRQSGKRRTDLVRDLQWWPTRTIRLDARAVTHASVDAFLIQWARRRPALINGYVGGVHELALHILERGEGISSPRAVGVTAAPVTSSQRATISDAFGAPVYDQYRSAEVPWIAFECSAHEGLHVQSDLRLLEVVDDAHAPVAAGVEGNVLLTDLTNAAFPLIRYEIGDRTRHLAGPCACGNRLERIAPVSGRVSDAITTPDGLTVTGGLTALFNENPRAVRQFQVQQHADYSVTLRYVPGSSADSDVAVEAARRELEQLLRGSVPVRSERVEAITHDRGKSRTVLSAIPHHSTLT